MTDLARITSSQVSVCFVNYTMPKSGFTGFLGLSGQLQDNQGVRRQEESRHGLERLVARWSLAVNCQSSRRHAQGTRCSSDDLRPHKFQIGREQFNGTDNAFSVALQSSDLGLLDSHPMHSIAYCLIPNQMEWAVVIVIHSSNL